MYEVYQCFNPRDFVTPRDKAINIGVMAAKCIFSVDTNAISIPSVCIANSLIQRFSQNIQNTLHDTNDSSHSKQDSTTIGLHTQLVKNLKRKLRSRSLRLEYQHKSKGENNKSMFLY